MTTTTSKVAKREKLAKGEVPFCGMICGGAGGSLSRLGIATTLQIIIDTLFKCFLFSAFLSLFFSQLHCSGFFFSALHSDRAVLCANEESLVVAK